MDPGDEALAARQLILRCVAGEADAIQAFQERYGELIYGYPMRVYQVAQEEAGDFYVYAFDRGRIFRRSQTYEGRAPFQAYLVAIVLDHLMIDWKRSERGIETVPLDSVEANMELQQVDTQPSVDSSSVSLHSVIAALEPRKAIIMKLLHVEDCEFTASELKHLREISGRGTHDLLAAVDAMRATVRAREAGLKRIEDSLDAVHAWISLYERRMHRLGNDLASLPPDTAAAQRLAEEHQTLEGKIKRRHQQREKLLAQRQRRKVTAPYKEIAAILNTTVGNVASMIARTRNEVAQRLQSQKKESRREVPTSH